MRVLEERMKSEAKRWALFNANLHRLLAAEERHSLRNSGDMPIWILAAAGIARRNRQLCRAETDVILELIRVAPSLYIGEWGLLAASISILYMGETDRALSKYRPLRG